MQMRQWSARIVECKVSQDAPTYLSQPHPTMKGEEGSLGAAVTSQLSLPDLPQVAFGHVTILTHTKVKTIGCPS